MTSHPVRRAGAVAVAIARHGRRFTATVLIAAAVVGISVGVAAPEISPVAPAPAVAAPAATTTVDDTQADTLTDARTGRGPGDRNRFGGFNGGPGNAGLGRGGGGGRR